MQRRLAAILAADIAGFSRLVDVDEEGTLAAQRGHRVELIDPLLEQYNGRIANTAGDSILIEFPSAVEAVRMAIAMQDGLISRNTNVPADHRIAYRIGINIGDVVAEETDLLGDGVNVAARLEALAPPGGIIISRSVRDHVRDRLQLILADLGEVGVKNIARPVRAFQVLREGERAVLVLKPGRRFWPVFATAMAFLLAASIGAVYWRFYDSDFKPANAANFAYPLPDRPSIAVLPFQNIADDQDQTYFADGLTEDIVTDISKISGIFVVAHGSTIQYKTRSVQVSQVAEELGVRYILGGSVRRAGDNLRITAQLADAVKGEQIWAERYDRKIDDVFAIQSEITRQVVRALAVTLKASENDRVFQKYVTNIDTYDAFLRARATVDAPTRENIEQGEALFRRVIELDPAFAGGYAGLSFNHSVKARFGYGTSPADDARQALELAQKAIEMDKNFAWSYIALAGAHLANGNHDAAVDAARQAIIIQPSGYESNLFMGFYLNFAGESALALKYLGIASELSRNDTVRGLDFLGIAYFTDGRYEECERAWTNRFVRLGTPAYPHAHVFLAACQSLLGEQERATATVARFLGMLPEFRMSRWLWVNNYKLPEHRQRLFDAAIKAGIPE